MTVTPIGSSTSSSGDGPATSPKTLREVVSQIDNEKDLQDYVMAYSFKVPIKPAEIKYERHPVRWDRLLLVGKGNRVYDGG